MKLGIRLPYYLEESAGTAMAQVARHAEAAGFDSGWVADHIVFPTTDSGTTSNITPDGKYPRPYDEPTLESWTCLAFVAGATQRLRLGVGVCVLPYRHPLVMAKVVASLDVLSGGRVLCGIGMGWLTEEFDALQVSRRERRGRMIEGIELMRTCWAGSPLTYSGSHYEIREPVHFEPRPPRGSVPVILGGHTPTALARAAALGDGWAGHELSPAGIRDVRDTLESAAPIGLRDGFTVVSSRLFNVPGLPADAARCTISGPEELAALFTDYEAAGLDILLCEPTVRTADALLRLIDVAAEAGAAAQVLV